MAIFLACAFVLSACDFGAPVASFPDSSVATDHQESSSLPDTEDNSSDGTEHNPPSSEDTEDNSSSNDDENTPSLEAMWDIVDRAYELKINEYLEGTYTLTGEVISVGKRGKKDVLTFFVEGRENKPIYCYNIQGDYVYAVNVGDTVSVSGRLTNFEYVIEFDNGCTLDKWVSANGEWEDDGSTDGDGATGDDTDTTPSTPAKSNEEAKERSRNFQLSGSTTVPDQAPTIATNRPKAENGAYIRNNVMQFSENGNAYTVVDALGEPAFTVYRDGGYITLEEVAAYVYAFGTYPANYTTSKKTSPTASGWGKHLRVNHTSFSGDTDSYPYEPVLPNISGCGGTLHYYEMDIGTTGTDCDPSYPSKLYNNGTSITRGAARIVYGKTDLNHNGIFEVNEHHVFYTYNHYNDFQEYLNYQGGWGELFGNITGGGKISSKTDYNPTPYVSISLQSLPTLSIPTTVRFDMDDYKTLLTQYI